MFVFFAGKSLFFFFSDKKYSVIHFTGYLKSWAPTKDPLEEDSEGDSDSCNLSCLVRNFSFILAQV